jgi:hypothetical protein
MARFQNDKDWILCEKQQCAVFLNSNTASDLCHLSDEKFTAAGKHKADCRKLFSARDVLGTAAIYGPEKEGGGGGKLTREAEFEF